MSSTKTLTGSALVVAYVTDKGEVVMTNNLGTMTIKQAYSRYGYVARFLIFDVPPACVGDIWECASIDDRAEELMLPVRTFKTVDTAIAAAVMMVELVPRPDFFTRLAYRRALRMAPNFNP